MRIATRGDSNKAITKKSKRYAAADKARCVSCGACLKECPRGAITIFKGCYAMIDPAICIGCGKCRNVCPADTIELMERGEMK